MSLLSSLLDLLFPPKCPFCGRVLERSEEGMCFACQRTLPWVEEGKVRTVEFCGACLAPLWYRDLAREGMTMLVVTHEMGFARNVAGKIVFMENGVVVETAAAREFFEHPRQERTKAFLRTLDTPAAMP